MPICTHFLPFPFRNSSKVRTGLLFSFSIQRKSQSEQHKPLKLANTYQNNIKEIRSKRINNLITKINRTEQEEIQLKYV
jgi:hypothetical protein